MRVRSQNRLKIQRGSNLLEGALVTGVFFMIIFGIVDFGRAVFDFNSVQYAANAGARYAAVHGSASSSPASESDVATYVATQLVGIASPTITAKSVNFSTGVAATLPSGNTAGNFVDVSVQYAFQPIAPYLPTGAWQMKGESRMLISQ